MPRSGTYAAAALCLRYVRYAGGWYAWSVRTVRRLRDVRVSTGAHVQHTPMRKTRWLRLRPAGSPEASLSASSCSRLPRASVSLGQSAAWAALSGHIGLFFSLGGARRRRAATLAPHVRSEESGRLRLGCRLALLGASKPCEQRTQRCGSAMQQGVCRLGVRHRVESASGRARDGGRASLRGGENGSTAT